MAMETGFTHSESQAISTMPASQRAPYPTLQQVVLMPLPPPENDYLFLSIISFFCCFLLAIPSLVFSLKTREANSTGNQRAARRYSRLALGFGLAGILLGAFLVISPVVVQVLKDKLGS